MPVNIYLLVDFDQRWFAAACSNLDQDALFSILSMMWVHFVLGKPLIQRISPGMHGFELHMVFLKKWPFLQIYASTKDLHDLQVICWRKWTLRSMPCRRLPSCSMFDFKFSPLGFQTPWWVLCWRLHVCNDSIGHSKWSGMVLGASVKHEQHQTHLLKWACWEQKIAESISVSLHAKNRSCNTLWLAPFSSCKLQTFESDCISVQDLA